MPAADPRSEGAQFPYWHVRFPRLRELVPGSGGSGVRQDGCVAEPQDEAAEASPVAGTEPASPVIRVVIVDDHPVVRRGLRSLLETLPGIEVVGEAADGVAAVREVCQGT